MSDLFSRILVGVDDSQPATDAVALAARLAHEHGGQLLLCYSVNWLPLVAQAESAAAGALIDPNTIIESLNKRGNILLAQATQTAKRFGIDAQPRTVEGEPAESLLQLAVTAQCSLIAMGTHARTGLSRLFIGSTTEAVLRGSRIPVLTVHPGITIAREARRCFERIVVGIDDSDPSDAAIEAVIALPAADRRQVLFYSIADIDTSIGGYGYNHTAVLVSLREQAQDVVDAAVASARACSIWAEGRVVDGSTQQALITAAQQQQADLIVLGSHGRRGLRRFFLGSVAESVVRSACVPVLVVRPAARDSGDCSKSVAPTGTNR